MGAVLSFGVVFGCIWLCTRGVGGFVNFISEQEYKAHGMSGVRRFQSMGESEWEDEDEDEE